MVKDLRIFFEKISYEKSLASLIKEGYLSRILGPDFARQDRLARSPPHSR